MPNKSIDIQRLFKSVGGKSFGPTGAVLAVGLALVGGILSFNMLSNSFLGRLRFLNRTGSNGGAQNSLTTIDTNATIYVKFGYVKTNCTSKYGGPYFIQKNSTNINCNDASAGQMADGGSKLGIKLNGTFYEGAAATNDITIWKDGASYPASTSIAQANTYWLYIPGYHNPPTGQPSIGVPVVDVISNFETQTNKDRAATSSAQDLRYRVNLMVKDAGEATSIKTSWKDTNNCKLDTGFPQTYDCAVSGVAVKFGQQWGGGASSGFINDMIGIAEDQFHQWRAGNHSQLQHQYYQDTGADGAAWCSYFASWVINKALTNAGKPTVGPIAAVVDMRAYFQDHQLYFNRGAQDPKPGDIFIMQPEVNGMSHTGIVIRFDGNTVTSVDGNTSSGVNEEHTSINQFSGFGRFKP